MAEIVLFHHVLGLTPGIVAFADHLRAANHVVHTPDLFDGRTFESIEDGIDHARSIGFGTVLERGAAAVETLPEQIVYGGFSLGVMPAQQLAQNRPGCRGALLFEACVPVAEFGSWPDGLPVQIHGMEQDPSFAGEGDLDAARALVEVATGAGAVAELFTYPGDGHLFTDSSLPSFDREATALVLDRVMTFLAKPLAGTSGDGPDSLPRARLND